MICGSMTFAKEMLKTKEILEEMGHSVKIPTDARDIVNGNHNPDDLESDYNHCVENDIMRTHFKFIEESDAILVLNPNKNDIKGYIGTSSLMEIGLAHHFYKKIFLLQPLPHYSEQRWAHEVSIMQPIIIDGDFSKIK
jgi:nucleoside 2-deoxyribosyltransferase